MSLKKICTRKIIKSCLMTAFFVLSFFAFSQAAYAAPVYFSVGQNTTSHEIGAGNVTVSGTTATFTVAQTATNMGVGDVVNYDSDNKLCYISGKTSTTVWSCTNATGGTPIAANNVVVNSISHAFASLSLAEAGAPALLGGADLASLDVQLNFPCYFDTGVDTTAVTIDGYTTDATRYIKIYTPNNTLTEANQNQRHSGKWDDDRYRISVLTASPIGLREDFVRIEGLQIDQGNYNGSALGWNLASLNSGAEYFISDSIFRGDASYTGGQYAMLFNTGPSINVKVSNCVFYNYDKTNSATRVIFNNGATVNLYLHNITIQGGYYAVRGSSSTYCKNCVSIGAVDGFNGLTEADAWNSNNASDVSDVDAPGGNKVFLHLQSEGSVVTDWFNSATDFHLNPVATYSSELRDKGADLSSDVNLFFSTDIDKQTRSGSWDIGADEAVNNVFYSVGQSVADLKSGANPTLSIAAGSATFSEAQAGNIGVGDRVTYNTNQIAYISAKTNSDSMHWSLVTATGGVPSDISNSTVVSITHEFTSLSAAVTAASNAQHVNNTDLVAANVVLNLPCYYDNAADVNAVTVSGYTTGANNYIKIYTPFNTSTEANNLQRHSGKWDDGKYKLDVPNGPDDGNIRTINIGNLKIDGLQIKKSVISYSGPNGINLGGADNGEISVSNNIIKFNDTSTYTHNGIRYGKGNAPGTQAVKIYNNLIYNIKNVSNNGVGINVEQYGVHFIYNNMVVNSGICYRHGNVAATVTLKNNIAQNCGDGYLSLASFNASSDYNISDLASDAPGANSKNSTTIMV